VLTAVTRSISPAIARCELTHLAREPIDIDRAVAQHGEYQRALADLGCRVLRLPAGPDLPDAVFIEDTAVVFDELAVIMRPGAESRQAETVEVAEALTDYRRLVTIQPPGTLDGGDVLVVDNTIFVGQSSRSNAEGASQLHQLMEPYGYTVNRIEVSGCLHLKTAVTQVADRTLLLNPEWVRPGAFGELEAIEVDPAEPFGANAVRIGKAVVYPSAFSKTRRRLEARGIGVRAVDTSELAKAEGGVTCCSLIFHS
jgi:dimethylargininase